jgi:uncharacterized membrane protein
MITIFVMISLWLLGVFCLVYPVFMIEKEFFKNRRLLLVFLLILMLTYSYMQYFVITTFNFINIYIPIITVLLHIFIYYLIYKKEKNKRLIFILIPIFYMNIILWFIGTNCWFEPFPKGEYKPCKCQWIKIHGLQNKCIGTILK